MKYQTSEAPEAYKPALSPAVSIPISTQRSLGILPACIVSLILHGLALGLIFIFFFLLQFLGIKIPLFDTLAPKARDIQFVLVNSPTAQPRNKRTHNRAEHASRAGGKKISNLPETQTMTAAGQPKPVTRPTPPPAPRQQAARRQAPQQRSVPHPKAVAQHRTQPTQQKTPAPTKPTPQPSPPSPKFPTPHPAPTKAPSITPPVAFKPSIRMPAAPAPKIATGPIVNTPGEAGGSSSSTPSPSQIPGTIGGGYHSGRRSGYGGGGIAGSGGHGSMNQYGSPGGGGGAPGVDALPEPDYGAYMAELQRRIKRNWNPPSAQEDKRVVVLFRIGKDGRLLSISLQESSGYSEADQAAMNAVRLSAPFRPLPLGHRGSDLPVQFTFDYNVLKGGGMASFRRL